MLRDVHCGAVKRFENSVFKNRNTHAANVSHLPAWSNNSFRYVTATALVMHHPDGFRHGGSVIRVDRCKILLKAWGPVLWVEAINLVYLVRPEHIQTIRPTNAQIV